MKMEAETGVMLLCQGIPKAARKCQKPGERPEPDSFSQTSEGTNPAGSLMLDI